MPERRFDAVIAGAGPAGSTTALRLARAGFSVAIVEAARFPRFKPCGEFMSPEVLPMLAELGVYDEVLARGAREVRGMLLVGHGRRAHGRFVDVGRAVAPFDHGFALRREVFDGILLDAARRTGGVEVFEGRCVRRLLRGADGAVEGLVARAAGGPELELRGTFTIGADGVRSTVAQALGVRRETPWLDKLALTTRFAGVPWGDRAEVHFVERGFFACAPVDGGVVTVNLVLERAAFESAGLPRDAAFEQRLADTPALADRLLRGRRVDPVRGVGRMATSTTAQTFAGAALVGDACGYVDPVTGEGIFFAIRGARMLSAALVDALHARRRDRGVLDGYLAGRAREIAPRAAFATLLQRGLRHPHLVRAVFGLLASRPRLADTLVSLAGDYVPLRELARPRVWLGALSRRDGAA